MNPTDQQVEALCKHVDAISAILGDRVVALVIVTRGSEVELVCPDHIADDVHRVMASIDWRAYTR